VQQILPPQEQPRIHIPGAYLDKSIADVQTLAPLIPAELIYNLDETV
jgi:hypothetical protein